MSLRGGPLSIACPTCGVLPEDECVGGDFEYHTTRWVVSHSAGTGELGVDTIPLLESLVAVPTVEELARLADKSVLRWFSESTTLTYVAVKLNEKWWVTGSYGTTVISHQELLDFYFRYVIEVYVVMEWEKFPRGV